MFVLDIKDCYFGLYLYLKCKCYELSARGLKKKILKYASVYEVNSILCFSLDSAPLLTEKLYSVWVCVVWCNAGRGYSGCVS